MIKTLGASLVLILVFNLCSCHRAPEILIISQVIGVSFVLMRWLWLDSWMASGWQLVPRKTKPWLEAWNFQPCPPFPWEGRRVKMELMINLKPMWWSLCKKTKVWGLGSFQMVHTSNIGKVTHPNSRGTEAPALVTFPDLTLCISLSDCSSDPF